MGVWAIPRTVKQAKALQKLMLEPLPASEACNKIYHLLGDDALFDVIGATEKKNAKKDVRKQVKASLLRFLRADRKTFSKKWNSEAEEICEEICRN